MKFRRRGTLNKCNDVEIEGAVYIAENDYKIHKWKNLETESRQDYRKRL